MRNEYQRIIRAVEEKAEALCPDSLALIGVYGSCATGDVHPRSDLDLLILIRDEKGRALADAFILEDLQGETIGFDLYCTTWRMLESDAECGHAHLAKLMDAELVCVKDAAAVERLETLRRRASSILQSNERFEKALALWEQAKGRFAEVFLTDSLAEVRTYAAATLNFCFDALMIHHGRYFRRGVKRTLEELGELPLSFDPSALSMAVIRSDSAEGLRRALSDWMRALAHELRSPVKKEKPCKENLMGSYEEMFSNWRNKMWEAEERGDLFASFMNLASLEFMLRDVADAVDVQRPHAMWAFDHGDLHRNTEAFEQALEEYRREYARVGMEPRCFADTDAFLEAYLKEV